MRKATFILLFLSLLSTVAAAQNVSEVRQLACPTLTDEPLAIEATKFGTVVLTAENILLFREDSCRELVSSGDSSVEGGKLVKTVVSVFGPSSDIVMSELSVQGEFLYFTTFGESGNWPDKVWKVGLAGVNPVPTEVFGLGSVISVDSEKVQITGLFEITPAPEGALVAYLVTPDGQGIYLINPKTLTAKLVFADTEKQVRLNNNQLAQPRRLYVVGDYVIFFYSRDKILSANLETNTVSTIHSGTRILKDTTLPIYMRLSAEKGNIYLLYPIWGGGDYSFTSEIVKWDFQTNIWKLYYNLDRGRQSWVSHKFDFIREVEVSMMGLVKNATKGFDRPTSFALMQGDFWQEVATVGDQFQNFSYAFAPGNQNNGYFGAQDQSGNWGLYSVRLVPENPNQPKIEKVVNAANGKEEPVAYQSIFSIYGKKLGFYQVAAAVGEPPRHEATFELGGANVKFLCGDLEFPARLIFNGENQVNGIVPLATENYQTCDVQVIVNGLSSNKMSVQLTDQNITLFEWFPHLNDPTKGEGIFTNSFYQLVGPESNNGAVRAKRGETVIGWSTGAGVTDPWLDDSQDASGVTHQWRETPIAYIGGVPVNLEYAVRAPGYNGLDQFGFKIPLGAYGLTPFWFSSDSTKIWWLYIED